MTPEGTFQKMGKAIKNMTGNQQVANKQVKDLYKKYRITDKNEQRKIHDYIHGHGYGYKEIEAIIKNGWYK